MGKMAKYRNQFTRLAGGWGVLVFDGCPRRGSLVDVWKKDAKEPEQVRVGRMIDEVEVDGVVRRRFSIMGQTIGKRAPELQAIFDALYDQKIDVEEFRKRRNAYFENKYPDMKRKGKR